MDKRSASELYEVEVLPDQTVWEPFIERGVLNGIVGGSEVGKSNFLRQLSIAIVTNEENFLGHPLHVRYGRVVYVSIEDNEVKVARIFQTYKPELQEDERLENLQFIFDFDTKLHDKLAVLLSEEPFDICIVDCMTDVYEGRSLNDHVEMKKFLRPYDRLAQEYKMAILFLHHLNKSADESRITKRDSTGSAAFEQKVRSLFSLTKGSQSNERIINILKGNYIPEEAKNRDYVLEFVPSTMDFIYKGFRQKKVQEGNSRLRITEDEKIRIAAFLIDHKVGKGEGNPSYADAVTMIDDQFGLKPSVGFLHGVVKSYYDEAIKYLNEVEGDEYDVPEAGEAQPKG